MAFNSLSERLQQTIKKISGKSRLTEEDIELMMREIRLSLLEADVNFKVVKDFTASVKEEALGEKVLKGLKPGEQVVKIVNEKLIELLGGESTTLALNTGLTVIMMCGLQGAGKTTQAAKLAYKFKSEGKKVLMVAGDIYRPAAINQLITLAKQVDCDYFELGQTSPIQIAKLAYEKAKSENYDIMILDTAGRLSIDEELMQELVSIKSTIKIDEILLTVDAMTGQDAVSVCETFNNKLSLTGAVITKLDGDTRGGAALSIKKVSGVSIKFSGTGEKITDLEEFHPERMASRILGMGDVLTLIETATKNIDQDEATDLMEKMSSGTFNYNDMLKQFKMVSKMGSMSSLLGMIPGMGKIKDLDSKIDDDAFKKFEIIINSMTKEERRNPDLIAKSSSRRQRIALGCGKTVTDVNKLRQALDSQLQFSKAMASGKLDKNSLANMKPRKSRGKGRDFTRRW